MGVKKTTLQSALLSLCVLTVAFLLSLLLESALHTDSLIPMIFMLAVFLVALLTDGYWYGVIVSLVSMLAVNYAFTFPYFSLDFSVPASILSALFLLTVTILTSTLTTKIRQAEKAKADSDIERMRANLLRAISHDLRTPLTSIYGSCSAIKENYDSLPKEQQLKLLGEIQSDAQWLIHMVENLLSVTKISGSDRVHIVKEPAVLEELADETMRKLRKRYPAQTVDVDIPDDFVRVPMDAILIEQVLLNLLENAIQHAKTMTQLSLRVFILHDKAVFEVIDNGCGISPGLLPHLFSGTLEKKDLPEGDSRRGMGIGLSVCATIIGAHGGAITAENRRQGGAVFRFFLPMDGMEGDENE